MLIKERSNGAMVAYYTVFYKQDIPSELEKLSNDLFQGLSANTDSVFTHPLLVR